MEPWPRSTTISDSPVVTQPAADDAPAEQAPNLDNGKKAGSGARVAFEWIGLVVLALVIALLIKTFLFQAFFIPSESMMPTLAVHDRVLVNKLSYKLHDVHRGDIVVFKAPEQERTAEIKDLVKRVIGLPNETVSAHGGHIYINGEKLDESYLPDGVETSSFSAVTLKPDHYWVMGDNRDNSKDSRVFGPIEKHEIIGRVFFRIWPLSRIGFM